MILQFDTNDSAFGLCVGSESPASKEIYAKISNKIETGTRWLLQVAIGYSTSYILLAVVTTIFKYRSSGGSRDSFRSAYPAA